jgi:hypothetical protein
MDAGMMPAITPKIIHIDNAKTIILGAIVMANGSTALKDNAKIHTKNNPTSPPIMHKNALSNKNS